MLTQAIACEFIKEVTALKVFAEFHTAILYSKYMTLKPFSHSFSQDLQMGQLSNKRRSVVLYSQIGSDMTWVASPGYTAALSDDYLYLPAGEWLLCSSISVQLVPMTLKGKKDLKMLI